MIGGRFSPLNINCGILKIFYKSVTAIGSDPLIRQNLAPANLLNGKIAKGKETAILWNNDEAIGSFDNFKNPTIIFHMQLRSKASSKCIVADIDAGL